MQDSPFSWGEHRQGRLVQEYEYWQIFSLILDHFLPGPWQPTFLRIPAPLCPSSAGWSHRYRPNPYRLLFAVGGENLWTECTEWGHNMHIWSTSSFYILIDWDWYPLLPGIKVDKFLFLPFPDSCCLSNHFMTLLELFFPWTQIWRKQQIV